MSSRSARQHPACRRSSTSPLRIISETALNANQIMAVRVRRTQHERAPAHNLTFCEHRGCRSRFYISGRHHCRDCGASVCSAHFVRPRCQNCHNEMPEIPTPFAPSATEGGPPPSDDQASGDGEQLVPRGLVDLHMCKDVYATSFVPACADM